MKERVRSVIYSDPYAQYTSHADPLYVGTTQIDITVDPENPRYFVQNRLLCAWDTPKRTSAQVILFLGGCTDVQIPVQATSIAPRTFFSIGDIDCLTIPDTLKEVGPSGMGLYAPPRQINLVHVEKQPSGKTSVTTLFPAPTALGLEAVRGAFRRQVFNVIFLVRWCDKSIVQMHDDYGRLCLTLQRLLHPEGMKSGYEQTMRDDVSGHLEWFCCELACHDRTNEFDYLVELGYLNPLTITGIVDAV